MGWRTKRRDVEAPALVIPNLAFPPAHAAVDPAASASAVGYSWNRLTSEDATALAPSLKRLTGLTDLNLWWVEKQGGGRAIG